MPPYAMHALNKIHSYIIYMTMHLPSSGNLDNDDFNQGPPSIEESSLTVTVALVESART